MTSWRFWIQVAVFITLTPVLLLLGVANLKRRLLAAVVVLVAVQVSFAIATVVFVGGYFS